MSPAAWYACPQLVYTTWYPYGKGKISVLNTLLGRGFPGLADVLAEVGTTQPDHMEVAKHFFIAQYRQFFGTSMEFACFTFHQEEKMLKIMVLPPTSANLLQHVLWAHLQAKLGKAADYQAPPNEQTSLTLGGMSRIASTFLLLLRVPQLHQSWLM